MRIAQDDGFYPVPSEFHLVLFLEFTLQFRKVHLVAPVVKFQLVGRHLAAAGFHHREEREVNGLLQSYLVARMCQGFNGRA